GMGGHAVRRQRTQVEQETAAEFLDLNAERPAMADFYWKVNEFVGAAETDEEPAGGRGAVLHERDAPLREIAGQAVVPSVPIDGAILPDRNQPHAGLHGHAGVQALFLARFLPQRQDDAASAQLVAYLVEKSLHDEKSAPAGKRRCVAIRRRPAED